MITRTGQLLEKLADAAPPAVGASSAAPNAPNKPGAFGRAIYPAMNTFYAAQQVATGEKSLGAAAGGAVGDLVGYNMGERLANRLAPVSMNQKFLSGGWKHTLLSQGLGMLGSMVAAKPLEWIGNKIAPWRRKPAQPQVPGVAGA